MRRGRPTTAWPRQPSMLAARRDRSRAPAWVPCPSSPRSTRASRSNRETPGPVGPSFVPQRRDRRKRRLAVRRIEESLHGGLHGRHGVVAIAAIGNEPTNPRERIVEEAASAVLSRVLLWPNARFFSVL